MWIFAILVRLGKISRPARPYLETPLMLYMLIEHLHWNFHYCNRQIWRFSGCAPPKHPDSFHFYIPVVEKVATPDLSAPTRSASPLQILDPEAELYTGFPIEGANLIREGHQLLI